MSFLQGSPPAQNQYANFAHCFWAGMQAWSGEPTRLFLLALFITYFFYHKKHALPQASCGCFFFLFSYFLFTFAKIISSCLQPYEPALGAHMRQKQSRARYCNVCYKLWKTLYFLARCLNKLWGLFDGSGHKVKHFRVSKGCTNACSRNL